MKFPINKIILPNKSFSKLLLCDFKLNIINSNIYKTCNDDWMATKYFNGTIDDIFYNIVTNTINDNNEQPNNIYDINLSIFSKENNFLIYEKCSINTIKDIKDINLKYSIFENSIIEGVLYKYRNNNEYNLPLEKYKILDVSMNHNYRIKENYNKINELITKF